MPRPIQWLVLSLILVGAAADAEQIYSYTNAQGRTVYVNGRQRVPAAYRQMAKEVDLSAVSLNRQLGNEMAAAVAVAYERMVAADPCRSARRRQRAGWARELLAEHGLGLAMGGGLVLVGLFCPLLLRQRRQRWLRRSVVLGALVGAMSIAVVVGYSALQRWKTNDKVVRLCEPSSNKTAGQQLRAVQQLRRTLKGAYGGRDEAIERALR